MPRNKDWKVFEKAMRDAHPLKNPAQTPEEKEEKEKERKRGDYSQVMFVTLDRDLISPSIYSLANVKAIATPELFNLRPRVRDWDGALTLRTIPDDIPISLSKFRPLHINVHLSYEQMRHLRETLDAFLAQSDETE